MPQEPYSGQLRKARVELRNFELINSLETFKDLFDSAHDLIHIADAGGGLLYVNHAWEKVLEYRQANVQGRPIYEFIEPEQREMFRRYRERLLAGNPDDRETQITMVAKSGRRIHLEGFVSAKIQDGEPLYTRGIFRDITVKLQNEAQLQRMNEELREREQNRKHLLQNAPDAIVVIDTESTIMYWNPKAEEVFGWRSEEIVGTTLTNSIIPAQYREAHEKGMRRYLQTGVARVLNKPLEITALHRSGREFFISLTISTTMQNGNLAFIAFLRDIDHEKKNQQELDRKKVELEQVNQDLQQFAHVVSHDMKEPVRKIGMYVNRLIEAGEQLGGDSRFYMERISKSAARLSKMIDDVLNYSFQSQDRHVFETVSLQSAVADVLDDLELVITEKDAVIDLGQLPEVEGVPVMLSQLFYNLIMNSLKFARPDVRPRIEIFCTREEDAGNSGQIRYEFTVRDNGIGFEQKDAERIFDRFSRLHSKSEYEGTGLGLALCKRIVEYHGGRIWAESHGEGATLRFVLPQKQRNLKDIARQSSP